MNIVIIFAGGSGVRMNAREKPKQFLLLHGKPIIVHTIECFQYHREVDGIVVACLESWIPYMNDMVLRYNLNKVTKIVAGGKTGQLSIYNGLRAAAELYGVRDNIALIHDGVRPLITAELISANIECVKRNGSAITVSKTGETFVLVDENDHVKEVPERDISYKAQAPQSFYLKDILEVEQHAISDGITDAIDSCSLMNRYGKELNTVLGSKDNIKITTPEDYYIFRTLYDYRENQQI